MAINRGKPRRQQGSATAVREPERHLCIPIAALESMRQGCFLGSLFFQYPSKRVTCSPEGVPIY